MLFVRHLGQQMERLYSGGEFRVHRKREGEEIVRPGETLHDIDVFKLGSNDLIERNIWQVESELAFSSKCVQGYDTLKPKLGELVEDINKLICGSADYSLLVTSKEWMENGQRSAFLDRIEGAARLWHGNCEQNKVYYIATIPFVSNWPKLDDSDLNSIVGRYSQSKGHFEAVPRHLYIEPRPYAAWDTK